MAREKMYELAFQYKDTKLWQRLYDDEIFAVRLTDGEIGYCSVMGMMGEHLALGLYVGNRGYQSFRLLLDTEFELLDNVEMGILLTEQDCLQCSFEKKDMLSDEELLEARKYASLHGRALRGKNAFPKFTKYRPGRYPWTYDSELDENRICDALSAAIALGDILCQYSKEQLGLHSLRENVRTIPLLSYEDGRWIVRTTALPAAEIVYPEPVLVNEVMAAYIKRKKKAGNWECGTLRIPNAVQGEAQEEAPYFPLALICVDVTTELVQQPIVTDGDKAEEMMNLFAKLLMEASTVPKKISCGDNRCFAILKDLCAKTGIQLIRTDSLAALSQVMEHFLGNLGIDEEGEPDFEQLEALFDSLMQMRDGELLQMPEEMVVMLLDMAEDGIVPDSLAKRIRKLFRNC